MLWLYLKLPLFPTQTPRKHKNLCEAGRGFLGKASSCFTHLRGRTLAPINPGESQTRQLRYSLTSYFSFSTEGTQM